jgi:serine/threonine protein kinase/class 3 adenylate cyclase
MAATVQTQAPQLELGHVLFIEIVGSGSPSTSDQRKALEQLQELVRSTVEFKKAYPRKQMIALAASDAMALVFFSNPERALRCAVEISRNARKMKSLHLRMGLHSGPVYPVAHINCTDRIADGGISVAQRVMDCGEDGHILISHFTAEHLQGLGTWAGFLQDLGEVDLKHGTKLHLFNFWDGNAGNSKPPKEYSGRQGDKSRPADQLIGQAVSHYRVLRKLGSGGMGVVYEAEDTRLGRHVALKLLPERFSRSPVAVQRFQREACTASSLNHPNICTIHDVGEHNGQHFIVMELLEGKNLKQVIWSGALPQERIAALGIQIAEGLEAAHARGIVHRDIKPANLFVIPRERIKILDFGLAKLTARERTAQGEFETAPPDEPTVDKLTAGDITSAGEFVGTVSYMSPEQARGEVLDHRTDLFSFGVVLYEMTTGFPPFRGDTSAVVFDAILNKPPAPVIRGNPQVSPELERIISRALEKSPDMRYQSAADMGSELRRLGMRTSVAVPEQVVEPGTKTGDLEIVVLYKRNAQPDEQIMQALTEKLNNRGYRVFVDRHLVVGVEWAHEIERKIGEADAVIPLLSAPSVRSEMLAYELDLARSFAERQNGKPRILPIRVQFEDQLPDSLHSVLDGLNYSLWKDSRDDERIIEDLSRALRTPQEAFRRRPHLEPVGGALALDSNFYIVRPTDEEFYSGVARNDSIILLKGARQMGKTSLMARGLQQARKAGARVVLTDFQKLNSAHLQSAESLFQCLAEAIGEQLDIDVTPEVWNPRRGASMNFERFLRREILAKIKGRLLWGIDEVDRLFACSFGSEVFGLFRSWHNERSLDPSGPWQNLSLAIAYASEAHLFITDVNQSPFNVGTRLVLADFTLDQVRELNERYGCPLHGENEMEGFFSLLGGQPFLTQRGLHQMAEKSLSYQEFAAGAARDEGPYGDHLRRIFVSLSQDPALCEVVRGVISGRHSSGVDSFYRLRSSGIVAGESARDMKLRCQLYEQYLGSHLS